MFSCVMCVCVFSCVMCVHVCVCVIVCVCVLSVLEMQEDLVVIVDGVCCMCSKFTRFVAHFNPEARFMWAQHEAAKKVLNSEKIDDGMDRITVIRKGRTTRGSDAFIQILLTMNMFFKLLGAILWLVPKFAREYVYDKVAANRYSFFGKTDACKIASPEMKAKFLHDI